MNEALERRKPQHHAAGTCTETQSAPPEIEDDQQRKYADDGGRADPPQISLVKDLPGAARRLLDHVGFRVRNATAALNPMQLVKKLLLGLNAC